MNKKKCSACQLFKLTSENNSHTEFHKNSRTKDGFQNQCKECHAKSRKESYFRYRETRIENQVKYNKQRYNNDENFRISYLLRNRLSSCLKKYHAPQFHHVLKTTPTLEYLGCSIDNLYDWLQFTKPYFIPESYKGELHLDHFQPISKTDLNVCWNWSNLRWLTAEQNLKKSAKLPTPVDKFKMLILKKLFLNSHASS